MYEYPSACLGQERHNRHIVANPVDFASSWWCAGYDPKPRAAEVAVRETPDDPIVVAAWQGLSWNEARRAFPGQPC